MNLSKSIFVILLVTISVESIYFFNAGDYCVDVSVARNSFPVSLIQTSEYAQVCRLLEAHWRRFGSGEFRMHILRTAEPTIDKVIYLNHNGYVHFYNESRLTVAKWYGAEHEEL